MAKLGGSSWKFSRHSPATGTHNWSLRERLRTSNATTSRITFIADCLMRIHQMRRRPSGSRAISCTRGELTKLLKLPTLPFAITRTAFVCSNSKTGLPAADWVARSGLCHLQPTVFQLQRTTLTTRRETTPGEKQRGLTLE